MLKRVLLLLDNSSAGANAKAVALNLCADRNAYITGLAVLDTPWITASQPEPLGGSIFKIQRDDELIAESHVAIKEILVNFTKAADTRSIPHKAVEIEGFPSAIIERLAHENDLIVIGQTTDVHFDMDSDTDVVVNRVARDNPRPLLIVPKALSSFHNESRNVVVAYDGSKESSRALHMATLLGLLNGKKVDVICAISDVEIAQIYANAAVSFLDSHGITAISHASDDEKHVDEVILRIIHESKPYMLCMGGFSGTGLSDFIFGSVTKKILSNPEFNVPLFIHH
jgi:nucleotide-binding universal stress UspA family protein